MYVAKNLKGARCEVSIVKNSFGSNGHCIFNCERIRPRRNQMGGHSPVPGGVIVRFARKTNSKVGPTFLSLKKKFPDAKDQKYFLKF